MLRAFPHVRWASGVLTAALVASLAYPAAAAATGSAAATHRSGIDRPIGVASAVAASDDSDSYVVRAAKPYAALADQITALGGVVTYRFEAVDGLAVDVPRNALDAIRRLVGPGRMTKDAVVPAPQAADISRASEGPTLELTDAELVTGLSDAEIEALATAQPDA